MSLLTSEFTAAKGLTLNYLILSKVNNLKREEIKLSQEVLLLGKIT